MLTCLLAQDDPDFEVVLCVHADEAAVEAVRAQVKRFPQTFSERVRIVPVSGGGRSRPLNVGLETARGTYAAFLDDDDLVTHRWTACVAEAAKAEPGRLVRSVAASRSVRVPADAEAPAASVALEPIQRPYPLQYDHIGHLHENATPICAFAIPIALTRHLGLRFDEELEVLEDWDFQLRAAGLVGVTSVPEITSLYQRWHGSGDTSGAINPAVWMRMRRVVVDRLNREPYLLGAGAVAGERRHADALAAAQAWALKVEADHRQVSDAYAELERYVRHVEDDLRQLEIVRKELEMTLNGRQPSARVRLRRALGGALRRTGLRR